MFILSLKVTLVDSKKVYKSMHEKIEENEYECAFHKLLKTSPTLSSAHNNRSSLDPRSNRERLNAEPLTSSQRTMRRLSYHLIFAAFS